jgi:hypothetical protein
MDKRIQDLISNLGFDATTAHETEQNLDVAPYIREANINTPGVLEADVVNNGFTFIFPASWKGAGYTHIIFSISTVDSESNVTTDGIPYDYTQDTVHRVEPEDINSLFQPGTEATLLAILWREESFEITDRMTYTIV